jgi:hypothetical protein
MAYTIKVNDEDYTADAGSKIGGSARTFHRRQISTKMPDPLINVAARVVERKTMIRIHLPTSCPAQDILRLVLGRIPPSSPERRGAAPPNVEPIPSTRKHSPPRLLARCRRGCGASASKQNQKQPRGRAGTAFPLKRCIMGASRPRVATALHKEDFLGAASTMRWMHSSSDYDR